MSTKNNVGLDLTLVNPVIGKLGELLSDYQVFYANLRGLHWNVAGDKFYELHALYEEYYNDMAEKVDEVAERIVMLGEVPANTFSEYLKTTGIKEISKVSDWLEGTTNVLETLKYLVVKQREIHALAIKAGDVGTVSLMNHEIKNFEKKIWMLSAYVK